MVIMDTSLYNYSLCISLPLMLFFGFHMLFARTPEKQVYVHYLRSRRLMGTALLILAANYAVHLFCAIRLSDPMPPSSSICPPTSSATGSSAPP